MAPTKILLFQQHWLGDVLFATPAIRAIRKKYPQAFIACLAAPRVEAVLKNNPYINEVIVCRDRLSVLSLDFWRMVVRLRKEKFNRAVFFHGSKTRHWLASLAGIGEYWECTAQKEEHRIDSFLRGVEKFGVGADGKWMDFWPAGEARAGLDQLLKEQGIAPGESYAVVHPGGNWALKRWPAEYFSQWIYYFREKYPWKVIVCGTEGEKSLAEKIVSDCSGSGVVSLCGKTSLDQLALLLKEAKLLLSNDSGPIHLAASQETPILGLYGPTSSRITGPISKGKLKILQKDVGCQVPCYFQSCHDHACMEWLTPQEVFYQTQQFLEAP